MGTGRKNAGQWEALREPFASFTVPHDLRTSCHRRGFEVPRVVRHAYFCPRGNQRWGPACVYPPWLGWGWGGDPSPSGFCDHEACPSDGPEILGGIFMLLLSDPFVTLWKVASPQGVGVGRILHMSHSSFFGGSEM